jgi:cobalt-zinc-cadmium efflux system outer membrane protein
MRRQSVLLLSLLMPLLTAGCAQVAVRAGFPDVRAQVAERTGHEVRWDLGTAEDEQAHAAVIKLLAQELTPDAAVQVALLNNRRLQGVYEQLGIAQSDLVQAGLLKNPLFEGSARFVHHDGRQYELVVVDDFIHILTMPLQKRLAAAELERAKLTVTGAVMDLAEQVRLGVLDYQADRQMLAMQRTQLDAAEASYDMAERLQKAGNVTELDASVRRSLYEQTKIDVSSAEAALQQDRERLNALMGLWGEQTQWDVAGDLPEVPENEMDLSDLEKRTVQRSLELAAAWRALEVAARQLGIKDVTSVLPQAEVGLHAEGDTGSPWALGPELDLPLPLFDQGRPVREAARAEVRRQWDDYTALAVEVRATARAARDRLLSARQQAVYYRDVIVPLQEQITHQTQLRYNAMFVGVFQLLQAKQEEIAVKGRHIERLRDYWAARAELEQILNGRLPGRTAAGIGMGGGGQ